MFMTIIFRRILDWCCGDAVVPKSCWFVVNRKVYGLNTSPTDMGCRVGESFESEDELLGCSLCA